MKPEILSLFDNYTHAVDVARKYLDISDLEEDAKDNVLYGYNKNLEMVSNDPSPGTIKFFTKELARSWSYWLAVWAELFWKEIDAQHVQLQRADMVLKIINRKRFLSVDEAMMYNRRWQDMRTSGYLSRYTRVQVAFIDELLRKDKEKRLDLLIKSLRNKKVNVSDYLKYGEAIAYFTDGKLFSDQIEDDEIALYFSQEELNVLEDIWQ